MRERTPSADDTPKRAPAPSREVASADAASEIPNDEDYCTATKLLTGISLASSGSASSSADRMVASTQSLEDLGVSHPVNAADSTDRQPQQQQQQQLQERFGHAAYRSAQTAQDKRSRLSNVINNLRRKVPPDSAAVRGNGDSPRKEEDDRNSVERNLETLEKYVMTVLNVVGVIKEDEEEDKSKSAEKTTELERRRKGAEDDDEEEEEEDPTSMAIKSEPSNEGDIEAAVVPPLEDSSSRHIGNVELSETATSLDTRGMTMEESIEDSRDGISSNAKKSFSRTEEERSEVEEKEIAEGNQDTSWEKKETRTLGTIIMERLSEHQVEERANVDDGRGRREGQRDESQSWDGTDVGTICEGLVDDLLDNVYRTIDDQEYQRKIEECEKAEVTETTESPRAEETKDSNVISRELSMTSLHCSLPLDKVASVLRNCQTSGESVISRLSSGSPSNPSTKQKSKPSSSVRHLCLYCDKKFPSISLRQRHTERLHQLCGGRRSERNSRKPSQNCQYCSEKCDTLEILFQHMVGSHGDRYHACVQCSTRYSTREDLMMHVEVHGGNVERTGQMDKMKENSSCKEFCGPTLREKMNASSIRERRSEEKELENQSDSRQSDSTRTKLIATRDPIDNPASPEFDSSFYSNVSCNIRENLLHHLDGKLQTMSSPSSSSSSLSTCISSIAVTTTNTPTSASTTTTTTTTESKSQQQQPQQQSYYEHSVNQIQLPIDISLTAATPVYSKDYSAGEEYENSSEYAQKACETSSGSRPRRVSFEKYNFPRKYDGKEQWTNSIKDLSKFDISTQLSLRKKQQLIKERLTRLRQTPSVLCEITEVSPRDEEQLELVVNATSGNQDEVDSGCGFNAAISTTLDAVCYDPVELPPSEIKIETTELSPSVTTGTEFSLEFADFMRLRKREQSDGATIATAAQEDVYVELSGEWSRKRIYICGACGSKHVTLKEMEEHKALVHPRVLCSHFELVDEQREHYQYLCLPGRCPPSDETRHVVPTETVCTKCAKNCLSMAELHRHMLECGGDHTWLLELTGSGKKKCKWRPFGSRSRRRRQRGMKRNIQNSQTQPRIIRENVDRPREKQAAPTGPRIRPSDRESIQKMLANLPPKRTTRKVLQDSAIRSQGKLRNVQTRTSDNSSRNISRNKAALRNKLLKNAKSIQRKRCRNDNITAVIESVVRKCHEVEKRPNGNGDKNAEVGDEGKRDAKEINEVSLKTVGNKTSDMDNKIVRPRLVGRPRVLGKKRNVKTKMGLIANSQFPGKGGDKLANVRIKGKFKSGATLETKDDASGEETFSPKNTPKNTKTIVRATNKDGVSPDNKKTSAPGVKNKNKLTQRMSKMKRSVDPVASMNASIKAKSQLRSQDGKFARNPNKDSSAKLSETRTIDDGKQKPAESVEIKIKLKTTQKSSKKTEVQPPRRVTRLSSDSDKMPTLEPVAQIVSSNEEYADKSTNDLPILSPATSSISLQDQKASRSSIKCASKEKEGDIEVDGNVENISEKSTREQKSTRGRKPKQEVRDITKRKEIDTSEENEDFENKVAKQGRTRSRKSLPVKNANSSENNKDETSKDEMNSGRELKSKKQEEGTKEMHRSISKTKTEKDFVTRDIPFEVKKLLGSVSTEDLLNTLELASNDAGLKRSLRYSAPRSRTLQTCDRTSREIDDEQEDGSKGTSKKEKIETIRKSSRKNIEKRNNDKTIEMILDHKDPAGNVTQNERNGKRDSRVAVKAKEIAIDSPDVGSKIDSKQQTRHRSLLDVKGESSTEARNDSFRKDNSLLGKRRRSRNRSINEAEEANAHEEQNSNENVTSSEKKVGGIDEATEKIDENKIGDAGDSSTDSRSNSAMANVGLSHLQSETNLSVDSGKENSLETSVSKLKATRPKKTWGARRERSSRKRSLNNVIGILTEGMNIPIEAQQQSVQVLTVQTSLDNPDRVTRNGSTQQPRGGESGNVIAADSAFSELPVLARNEQESSENAIVTATSATNDHHADDERNARSGSDKVQNENAFVDQKSAIAKARSPANDIILDLSRRKPKGKGSFLEKIVSKIAKQKDALLENEVGSLLDSAAEELTSILNEVGPTLVDNVESENAGVTTSHALERDNNKNATDTSYDKEPSIAADPQVRPLENDKINIESAAPECSADLLLRDKIQDNLEENSIEQIGTQIQSEKEAKINSASNIETRSDDNVDAIHFVDESQIESREDKSTANEETIVTEISSEISSSLTTNTSTEASSSPKKGLEKLEKRERVKKSRRKSNKRSLEDASWPRKNKRKSVEIIEEPAEENITQKELHLDDAVTIISRPEFHVTEQNVNITKSLNEDVDFEKIQHESKTVEDNSRSNLEENNAEGGDKVKLEKSYIIPEDTKSISILEESTDKITSEMQDSAVADVLSTKISEERSIDSPMLFSKNSTENGNSAEIIKENDQTDTNESTSRHKSRRKSRLSAIFPETTNTDLFQTSIKSADESEKQLSSEKQDTLQLTDRLKVGTIVEDTSLLTMSEQSSSSVQTASEKEEEAQNTAEDSSYFVDSASLKTKRKRGAKKKSLADEHLELPVDEPVELAPRLNEETSVAESNGQLTASLEHFKVPEVKDLLQSTKKRSPRKKSLSLEEGRWNGVPEESRINEDRAEKEIPNVEKPKEQGETEKCVIEEQLGMKKFERSSSSGSIELASTVTRSRRKTQLSNEDLVNSVVRNQEESTDDLSENSCANGICYFRGRFAKMKRKEKEETDGADSFVAESESSRSNTHERNKRKSLCDEHLDLSDVDDIDVPIDIQASLENTKALENIEREIELADKSSDVQNEDANKPATDDSADNSANKDSSENVPAAPNDPDSPDDSVTLKKRAADNFVVVHKKTGEIMIVEKRKKLTKEAAKFFCEVCATSFTRKSSLKKHTLSQWHLLQTEKFKDKLQLANDTVFRNDEVIANAEKNDRASDQRKSIPEDVRPSEILQKSLEPHENYASYAARAAESTASVMNIETAKQETLEDKLLDEEICKITENMSHDEYVLTDHITPEKPLLSTPIKPIQKKHEDTGRGKNGDKKRAKSKKKNLADEHLLLDSPELEKSKVTPSEFTNTTNDAALISPLSCSSTKEMSETAVEKIENQAELLVDSANDATVCTSSVCEVDVTAGQHIEPTRSSRRALRKLSTVDNEEKEESQTEPSRFSLRPRRSKHFQHYEESDVEADVYFMDITNTTNDAALISPLSCSSTKEMSETAVEKIENHAELLVDSANDATVCTSSVCDVDVTAGQHIEPTKSSRRALRKLSTVDNEEKEESQTEPSRFSLRPRRSKHFQHYEESDVEADVYFMDINSDETENQCKDRETNGDALSEAVRVNTEDNISQETAKPTTNETRKRKRGRPRLKGEIGAAVYTESEGRENSVAVTSVFEGSNLKDQNPSVQVKEHLDDKLSHVDANIQPPKRSRGRPRKNPASSSLMVRSDSAYESLKVNSETIVETASQIDTSCETATVEKVAPVLPIAPAINDQAPKLCLSETETSPMNVEKIRNTELNTSENQSTQVAEEPAKTADVALAKDCDNALDVSSEKDKDVDKSLSSKVNARTEDAEVFISQDEPNHDKVKENALPDSTAKLPSESSPRIIEEVSVTIDHLPSAGVTTDRLDEDESSEVQELPDISVIPEEKRPMSGEEAAVPREKGVLESSQDEAKLPGESEGSEDEDLTLLIAENKSLPVVHSHESQYRKTTEDLENEAACDEKTIRLESSGKRLHRNSVSKERGADRKRSKGSRGKREKLSMSKITELSSDSENEDDKIESASANKSKIVKSVFGRVFGGEKTDKMKEVLNDWVSRSEDDSDMSRSASNVRSCPRGSTKISASGHKKDKKRHWSSDAKKDTERVHKKKTEKDAEVHGKSKNRKKREKDTDSTFEDHTESLGPAKRRYRESKIKADERILRTFESPILSDEGKDADKIKEMESQFRNGLSCEKDEESKEKYHEEEWNKEQTERDLISDEWENPPVSYDAHRKSNNDSSHRKRRDVSARNECSSSPSQFSVFKYKWRESKTKADERIWRAFDNETSPYLSDDQRLETSEVFKKQASELYASKDANHLNNSSHIKQKTDDTWGSFTLEHQDKGRTKTKRGRPRKDTSERQDLNARRVGRTRTDDAITKDRNDGSPIASEIKTKNGTQSHETTLSASESRNQSKHPTVSKDSVYDSSAYGDLIVSKHVIQDNANSDRQSPGSRKSKLVIEEWKRSARSLKFNQDDLVADDRQLTEKDESMISRSYDSLADEAPLLRTQLADFDRNSQTIRQSDDDEEENEDEDEDEDDNDIARRRMSPLYARDTPDSSIENSEEEDEEEEELATHEDNSRKTHPNEFSGEKIVIRSPSSGHRSDIVTIAPTDAIEDNALDVPREIESTTEPLQGKILNCDEELFVECCSRLKASSENELRGAKKIKLDHTESYHRQNDQPQGLRANRDRWRDVESQNSLGSLLESVNQLLGSEEMNSHDRSYRTHGSERSSRSASPDRVSRVDNLGYEDSLDVAFEYNNKLRDKIQQRMRESENLIASTFGQKINVDDRRHPGNDKRDGNLYFSSIHDQQLSASIGSNREQESSPGHKNKTNSTLGGLLDKALSNLLHGNGKHDQNGSAPMKLLAELACARAPTSTPLEDVASGGKNHHQSVKTVTMTAGVAAVMTKDITAENSPKRSTKELSEAVKNSPTKKTRNPIKELFERKKEINERKEHERSKTALVNSNAQKQRKPKKSKKQQQQQQQEFPLIRRSEHFGGLMEKKKRRGSLDRKGESEKIKDVYEFDEEESQTAPTLGSVMSYRCQAEKNYESNWKTKSADGNFDTALENDKTNYIADVKSNAAVDRKFHETEKFAPKTKGALKSFQSEEQQQQQVDAGPITGPMDEFVERKQQRLKRSMEQSVKQSKFKKRGKGSKKRARNAWYENDSSDEFRTAAKAEDVGVGISKSQRTCSKGKQNLFAELSTSESEYERDDYEIASERRSLKSRKSPKKSLDAVDDADRHVIGDFEYGSQIDWRNREARMDAAKKDHDVAKSESEMSDHSLVIDERKTTDEARNSDDDNQYERTFELDDLYREDTSDAETDGEENEEPMTEDPKNEVETQVLDENVALQTETVSNIAKDDYSPENELIPLEEALDILDGHDLDSKSNNICTEVEMDNVINGTAERLDETSNDGIVNEEMENKQPSPPEIRNDKEEPDDDVPTLPEKLSGNEKPQKESDNLPLHVFLSRKVQESKKRKQQQLDKLREEQERILMDLQPTRRQRKCAIGKQGLLAEISSSDEETYARDNNKRGDHDKPRKKRESKEKKKERYLEKKHEQMIAKEQKAIEEEILREVGKKKEVLAQSANDGALSNDNATESNVVSKQNQERRHQTKEKQRKSSDENIEENTGQSLLGTPEETNKSECVFPVTENIVENSHSPISEKRRKLSKSPVRSKKISKSENGKTSTSKKSKESAERSKKSSAGKDTKERKSFSGKRDSDDEELKTTKSWNKVEEGVGVAIGRRKRTAALQLYYWSSSSDEEEAPEPIPAPEEEEDDRQEQHGWIVGDSHKRMITMLAMEKQLKERRRRSEDEFELGKSKSKKHRNSTS